MDHLSLSSENWEYLAWQSLAVELSSLKNYNGLCEIIRAASRPGLTTPSTATEGLLALGTGTTILH